MNSVTAVFLFWAFGQLVAPPTDPPLSLPQFNALRQLLKDSSHYRIASSTDCRSQSLDDHRKEEPRYHPYYARLDVNGDGRQDFLVTFRAGKRFDLYFVLASRSGYLKPKWFASADWLDDSGIFVTNTRIRVGRFFSDDVIEFAWDQEARNVLAIEQHVD